MHPRTLLPLALLCACAAPAPAPAPGPDSAPPDGSAWTPPVLRQSPRPPDAPRQEGDRVALAGIGFTDDPDAFLIGGEVDFYQSEQLAIGPMLQLGLDNDFTILAPSFQAKYFIPMKTGSYPKPAPFVQGGIGIAWVDPSGGGTDSGVLLHGGGGLELLLDDKIALATTLTINFVPSELGGENAWFSWQLIQIAFRF